MLPAGKVHSWMGPGGLCHCICLTEEQERHRVLQGWEVVGAHELLRLQGELCTAPLAELRGFEQGSTSSEPRKSGLAKSAEPISFQPF